QKMRWLHMIIIMIESSSISSFHSPKHLPHYIDSSILNSVLDGYDKRVGPTPPDGPVIIHMTIVLGILTELRENQQVASIVMSHVQRWIDPGLSWDPDKFNGTRQIIMPVSSIWVPKMFIYNSMETKSMLPDEKFDARINYRGEVKVNNPEYVTVICRLNIDNFPFDVQFCAIAFASPLLNVREMDVNVTDPPKDSYFTGNAEWEVVNVSTRQMTFLEDGEYRVEVHYIMSLKRRPIYYVTVIVVPTFLISALSILGIFSPGTNDGPRNEKVSLGLGSLLAMTVLLDIVASAMPKSNSIPLLGYFIVAEILVCALAVAVSMGLLSASRSRIQEERMPSEWLYALLFLQTKRKMKFPEKVYSANPPLIHVESIKGDEVWERRESIKIAGITSVLNYMTEIANSQRVKRDQIERSKWKSKLEYQWNRIFSRLDHFLLLSFQLINLATLLAFLRYAFHPIPSLPSDFSV
ncbi:lgc-9, partial [Pristionchus pacificus]